MYGVPRMPRWWDCQVWFLYWIRENDPGYLQPYYVVPAMILCGNYIWMPLGSNAGPRTCTWPSTSSSVVCTMTNVCLPRGLRISIPLYMWLFSRLQRRILWAKATWTLMASLMKHDTQLQACRALQCPSFVDVIDSRTLLLKMGHCDGKLRLEA